jgi:hypothetical protein
MVGLRPFEDLVADGLGAQLWIASESGKPAGGCPFCNQSLHAVPPSAGGPEGMAMCRLCQQVWLPSGADSWVTAHAGRSGAGGPSPLAAMPTRCEECGAPWQPDDMGRCHYCQAQLTVPTVVVFETPPAPAPRAADVLMGALARFVTGRPDLGGL